MKEKEKNTKNTNVKKKHISKKFILVLIYIIILPLVIIPASYITTYVNAKPVLFGEKSVKISKSIPDFTFSISVSSYQAPVVEDGKITSSNRGRIKISETISETKCDISNIRVTYQTDANWYKDSATLGTTQSIVSFIKKGNGNTANHNTILRIDKKYPVSPIPFVKISKPNIYAKVEYDVIAIDGTTITKTYYLKYTPNKYITELTTIS